MPFPLLLALLLTLAPVPTPAQTPDDLPQIAPAFRAEQLGAVTRFRGLTQSVGGCSAVLIAPRFALTAGHCTGSGRLPSGSNARGMVFFPDNPPPLYRQPAAVAFPHPRNDGAPATVETAGFDVTLVRLAVDVPAEVAAPLPIAPFDPAVPHAMFGYLNASGDALHGHDACQVVRISDTLLGSNCRVRGGFSGGALVRQTAEGWALVGISVAQVPGDQSPIRVLIAPITPGIWPELDAAAQFLPE